MTISHWLWIDHCEYVAASDENILGINFLAIEEERLDHSIVKALVLHLLNCDVLSLDFRGKNSFTLELLVLVHRYHLLVLLT